MAFSQCRPRSKDYWRVQWVHLSQVQGFDFLGIIFYHEGLLLAQRGSLGDQPNLRARGGAYAPPYPTIEVSEVALRRVNEKFIRYPTVSTN